MAFLQWPIGSDYYKELLLQLEHRVGYPGEPVGVKTPLGWTIVGLIPGEVSAMQSCIHVSSNFTPEVRVDDLMRKMWDEDVMGISNRD